MGKIDWSFSCGRYFLTVDGVVVAMEGDQTYWTGEMIKACAESKNKTVKEIAGTLYVNGFAAAAQGEKCRDANIEGTHWRWEDLKAIADKFNKKAESPTKKRKHDRV